MGRFSMAAGLAAVGLAVLLAPSAVSQSPVQDGSTETKPIEPPRPDVSGSYYFGDGLGVNCRLILKPNDTFTFTWHGCLGEYDRNSGPFEWDGEKITLRPTEENSRDGFEGTPTNFYPIQWGDRQYLIADEDMLEFCHRIFRGWRGDEPMGRSSFYYLRESEVEINSEIGELDTIPEVPAKFEPVIEKGFFAKVIAVKGKEQVTIDKGLADGVVPKSHLTCGETAFNWLRVVKVSDHEAICERWGTDDVLPKIGDTVSAEQY